MNDESSLVIFTKASQMLAEANTIQKAKELKDLALTAMDWAKRKHMGEDAIKLANSYAIQAEIKLGEMLKSSELATGGTPYKKSTPTTVVGVEKHTLKQMGLTYKDSSRAQKLVDMDDDHRQEIISGKITVNKAVKEFKSAEKQVARKEALIKATKKYKESEDIRIYFGDCLDITKKNIEPNSVDLILTDPPYPFEFIDCWSKLSKLAEFALKPSGLVIAMSGQLYLPDVIKRMSEHLEYYWMMSVELQGQKQIVHPVNMQCAWKPLVIFQKAPKKKIGYCPLDILSNDKKDLSKQDHKWEQPVHEFEILLERFSEPGQLILDPFTGSGTTLVACKNLKRKCIGIELDSKNELAMKGRLI